MVSEIALFVNWVHRGNPQARTWRDYGYDLGQFCALVGDRPPTSITVRDIDHFVTVQATHGFTATTIDRRLAALTAFFTLS